MRCKYLVCADAAAGKVRLNALDPMDRAIRAEVPLCDFHALALERWVKSWRPHLTPDGTLYIGELDELCKKQPA